MSEVAKSEGSTYGVHKASSQSPSRLEPYPNGGNLDQLLEQKKLLEQMIASKQSTNLLGLEESVANGSETIVPKMRQPSSTPPRGGQAQVVSNGGVSSSDVEMKQRGKSERREDDGEFGRPKFHRSADRVEQDRSPTITPRTLSAVMTKIKVLQTQLDRHEVLARSTAWSLSATQKSLIPSFFAIKPKDTSVETMRTEMKAGFEQLRKDGVALAQNPYERPWRVWLVSGDLYGQAVKTLKRVAPSMHFVLSSPSNVEQQEYQCRTLRAKIAQYSDMRKDQIVCFFPKKKNQHFDANDDWCLKVGGKVVCSMSYDHQAMEQCLSTKPEALKLLNDMSLVEFENAWAEVNSFMKCRIEFLSDNFQLADCGLARGKGKGKAK